MNENTYDWTDDFDKHITALDKASKWPNRKEHEIDARIAVYERLITAKIIASSLLGSDVGTADVLTILSEISAEARFIASQSPHGENE